MKSRHINGRFLQWDFNPITPDMIIVSYNHELYEVPTDRHHLDRGLQAYYFIDRITKSEDKEEVRAKNNIKNLYTEEEIKYIKSKIGSR